MTRPIAAGRIHPVGDAIEFVLAPTTDGGPVSLGRLRRADQAAHHRAAARHDAAGDDPRRGRAARIWTSCVATMVGGTLRGRQRERAQLLPRPRHRRGHAPYRAPAARAPRGLAARGAGVRQSLLGVLAVGLDRPGDELAGRQRSPRVAIAFYVIVYTMLLKRRTSQNIVWGGAAGLHAGADRLGRGHRRSWPGRRSSCSSSCSSGRRRTSGRWRSATARTTRAPVCRCCRSSRRRCGSPARSSCYSWLTVADVAAAVAGRDRLGLRRARGRCRRGAARCRASAAARTPGRPSTARPMRLFHLSNSYLAFVFVAVAIDTFVR